jgi:hypothetical protein
MSINFTTAQEIAERHIREQIVGSEFLSHYEFGKVEVKSENERFWTFVSGSDQLFQEGYVPGAVYACVDKTDGHLWSMDDVERFYLERAAARQSQSDSVAA